MRGRNPSNHQKVFFVSCLVIASIAVFVFRYDAFGDLEPRSDQAFFSWWVQGLYQADHILPDVEAGESWLGALQRDDGGFLHRLLRPIYGRAFSIFTLVPLGLRYAMTWVLGPTYGAQVVMSLIAGSAIVLMLGLFPICARGRQPNRNTRSDDVSFGAVALLLGAATAYFHIYSPWGVHNFGVLFLMIAAALGSRVLSASTDKLGSGCIVVAFACGLAYFAHWTNVFLLPAAMVFSIFAMPGLGLRKRLSIIIGFGAFSAVLAIPFLISAYFEDSRNLAPYMFTLRGFSESGHGWHAYELLLNAIGRAANWLEKGSQLFSAPGLALGVLGLAAWAQRERVTLPLFIILTHFAVWSLIPLFGAPYFRTFLYATPFLVLGIAYLSVNAGQVIWAALRRKRFEVGAFAAVAVLGMLATHIFIQIPVLFSTQEIKNRNPHVWEFYFSGQGALKPAMAEIDNILPERAVIVTWGYGVQYLLKNYEVDGPNRTVAPTLLTLIPRFENGTLSAEIERRRLFVPTNVPMFTLIDHGADRVDRESVRRGIENVFGSKGFGILINATLVPVGRWQPGSIWPHDVALYRVEID